MPPVASNTRTTTLRGASMPVARNRRQVEIEPHDQRISLAARLAAHRRLGRYQCTTLHVGGEGDARGRCRLSYLRELVAVEANRHDDSGISGRPELFRAVPVPMLRTSTRALRCPRAHAAGRRYRDPSFFLRSEFIAHHAASGSISGAAAAMASSSAVRVRPVWNRRWARRRMG